MAGLLSPADEQERQYQLYMAMNPGVRAWRQSFVNRYGEQPDTETDPTYDYRKAWAAGEGPTMTSHDSVPHWGSAGKKPGHPTEWKAQFMQAFGIDPDDLQPDQVTPEMQAFFARLLPRGLLSWP